MRTCDFCKKPIDGQYGKIHLFPNNYEVKMMNFDACDECIEWAKGILRAEMGNR